jgi:hypothetical protein
MIASFTAKSVIAWPFRHPWLVLFAVTIVCDASAYAYQFATLPPVTASGGVWTQQTNAGARTWYGLTSSSDGTKLAAGDYGTGSGGYIYTSTDSGATWTQRTGAGSIVVASITSSSDGTKLAAGDFGSFSAGCLCFPGGYIYTSTDSGATWTQQTNAGARTWYGLTSSSDGTKLAAGDYGTGSGGYIYTNTDCGGAGANCGVSLNANVWWYEF